MSRCWASCSTRAAEMCAETSKSERHRKDVGENASKKRTTTCGWRLVRWQAAHVAGPVCTCIHRSAVHLYTSHVRTRIYCMYVPGSSWCCCVWCRVPSTDSTMLCLGTVEPWPVRDPWSVSSPFILCYCSKIFYLAFTTLL